MPPDVVKNKLTQFFRFARTSLLATLIDFLIGYGLTAAALTSLIVATIIGSVVSIVFGFYLNKFWVFRDKRSAETTTQFVRYAAVAAGNTALNTAGVWAMVAVGMTNYWLIRVLVGTAVFVFYSYVVTKAFVFASPRPLPVAQS